MALHKPPLVSLKSKVTRRGEAALIKRAGAGDARWAAASSATWPAERCAGKSRAGRCPGARSAGGWAIVIRDPLRFKRGDNAVTMAISA